MEKVEEIFYYEFENPGVTVSYFALSKEPIGNLATAAAAGEFSLSRVYRELSSENASGRGG